MGVWIANFGGKGSQFIKPGGKNFYEIVYFLKAFF